MGAGLVVGLAIASLTALPAQAVSQTAGAYCVAGGALRSQLGGQSNEHRRGSASGALLGAWSMLDPWTTKQTSTGVTGQQWGYAWSSGGVRNAAIVCGGINIG